jgi:hypothetical protein
MFPHLNFLCNFSLTHSFLIFIKQVENNQTWLSVTYKCKITFVKLKVKVTLEQATKAKKGVEV